MDVVKPRSNMEGTCLPRETINYTLTTNALSLDEQVRDYLLAEDISVILSLDGRPQVHDRMRILADGRYLPTDCTTDSGYGGVKSS